MADIAGNLSPSNADFLPHFKAIGQGLKKRFFRKPNVAEAVEQYEELALELQRGEQTEFSALCYLEAAKCNESLKNPIQQANLLLKTGRLYLAAGNGRRCYEGHHTDNLFFSSENMNSSISGNMQLAVQCLSQAAKIYQRENFFALSILLTMEIAEALFNEGSYGEALKNYKSALDTARSHFTYLDQALITEYMIQCRLEMSDYDGALKTITDLLTGLRNCSEEEISVEFCTHFTNRLEISRVCLLLLLGTNSVDVLGFIWPEMRPGKESASGSVLSTDRVERELSNPPMGLRTLGPPSGKPGGVNVECESEVRNVQIHLKSLVIAVQHGSAVEIDEVKSRLAPIMQRCHHDLFGMLVKSLC